MKKMFVFSEKKEIKTERHEIPKEHRMAIYELISRYESQTGGRREKYALWLKVQKIFPNLDIEQGKWSLDLSHIMVPSIRREVTL